MIAFDDLSTYQRKVVLRMFSNLSKGNYYDAEIALVDFMNLVFDRTLGEDRIVKEQRIIDFILHSFNNEYIKWAKTQNLDINKEIERLSKGNPNANFAFANTTNPVQLLELAESLNEKLKKIIKDSKLKETAENIHDRNSTHKISP